MTTIIDGKAVAQSIRTELKEYLANNNLSVGLAVIIVGEDPASQIYVRNKVKACDEIGITSFAYNFPADATEQEIIDCILKLNNDTSVNGILVQLPLPKHLNEERILATIDTSKDVDGFSAESIGKLALGKDGFKSCTPYGVIKLLDAYNIDICGKNAVIIGRSNIVGKPLALMLLQRNATVTVCHSKTANLREITKQADILISATGRPLSVSADMVKQGAAVIDVGISKLDGKTVGDVDFEKVSEVASYITPVPGGVGPMTIAMLMSNTVYSVKK